MKKLNLQEIIFGLFIISFVPFVFFISKRLYFILSLIIYLATLATFIIFGYFEILLIIVGLSLIGIINFIFFEISK
tara:strand:+ start:2099 stop:2326 length:228 start_codon:yes stop_codon:yes gene_type:complete